MTVICDENLVWVGKDKKLKYLDLILFIPLIIHARRLRALLTWPFWWTSPISSTYVLLGRPLPALKLTSFVTRTFRQLFSKSRLRVRKCHQPCTNPNLMTATTKFLMENPTKVCLIWKSNQGLLAQQSRLQPLDQRGRQWIILKL